MILDTSDTPIKQGGVISLYHDMTVTQARYKASKYIYIDPYILAWHRSSLTILIYGILPLSFLLCKVHCKTHTQYIE